MQARSKTEHSLDEFFEEFLTLLAFAMEKHVESATVMEGVCGLMTSLALKKGELSGELDQHYVGSDNVL